MNLSSLESTCELTIFLASSILFILGTIVFCFWCIYLLDGVRRKWKCYRNASDYLERDENNQEKMMAYNAKNEFTKYVFLLLCRLLVVGPILKWLALFITVPTTCSRPSIEMVGFIYVFIYFSVFTPLTRPLYNIS